MADDYIDTRDLVDELAAAGIDWEADDIDWEGFGEQDREHYAAIIDLFREIAGYAGDRPEDGIQLIADGVFVDYAQELADDIGAIDRDAGWPTAYIDWEAAARALQMDYTPVVFDGTDYWYR